ncbi:SMI1/KNR4 family protein [Streptomyces sp. NPDC047108]|uniref:SMI1/KNR4 family protein n=1 Tax=Streptomyces sp. NPDC047108 TaxID=3155025 RepID=UPI0033FDED91
MPSLRDFATWEPVLRLLRDSNKERLEEPGGYVAGRISLESWSLPLSRGHDMHDEIDAVERVHSALMDGGLETIAFVAEIAPSGKTTVQLFGFGPAAEEGIGAYPGALVLVEDAVPEPWRRLPDPMPDAKPSPTADPALLERTLRERLPDAVAATEAEIAAAERRLGVALPDELKAFYRVTRARWEDWDDNEQAAEGLYEAVGFEPFSLEDMYIADAPSRSCPWDSAAMDAVVTPPDAAVQGLVGSPGWIVCGDNGGGDRIAVDLTPGPAGHLGQVIILCHEENTGAHLLADSLTAQVVNDSEGEEGEGRAAEGRSAVPDGRPPAVAWVNARNLTSVQAAAHAGLEVLSIGRWDGEPFSLGPVTGLPRLRTLSAWPGTLADPMEVAELARLEFLELGPDEWRVLLAADAVPRTLSAAAINVTGLPHPHPHPLAIVTLANELLALWDRPAITHTVFEGRL